MDERYAAQPDRMPEQAGKVAVEAALQNNGVEVRTASRITCPHPVIWETLTDYDHLAGFIPGIVESRVIERQGAAAIVRQRGYASFMFLSVPLDVVVESRERPPSAITIRVLQGNLKRLDGGYHLHELPGAQDEYILGWSGVIEPAIPMPMAFLVPFLRAHIEDQFVGMLREIGRRRAASEERAKRVSSPSAGGTIRLERTLPAAA